MMTPQEQCGSSSGVMFVGQQHSTTSAHQLMRHYPAALAANTPQYTMKPLHCTPLLLAKCLLAKCLQTTHRILHIQNTNGLGCNERLAIAVKPVYPSHDNAG